VVTPDPDASQSGNGYDAQTTAYTYDFAGRQSTVTQPDGGVVSTTYWPTGAVKRVSGSRTYPSEYTYDPQGRIKTLTTWQDFAGAAGAAVTTWNYTPDRGLLQNKRYADNTGPSYTNKPSGRLLTRTWADGVVTTYGYNGAGDPTGSDYSDTTPDVVITYDRAGRPKARSDASGLCTWSYDASGQLKDEDYSSGLLNTLGVHRTFDALGRLDSVSVPSVYAAGYTYDAASRLDVVSSGSNSATYSYVPNSPLSQSATFKQGTTHRLTTAKVYDKLNRLASITNTPSAGGVQSVAYQYNNANQRTRATREDSAYWDYGYDALGQVNSAVKKLPSTLPISGLEFAYTYDDIGNRKTATVNSQVSTYTPTLLNTYTDRTVPGVVDVLGVAASDAKVTAILNSGTPQATTRQGGYFFKQLAVDNTTAAQRPSIKVTGVKNLVGPSAEDAVTEITKTPYLPQTLEAFTYDADGNLTDDARWHYTWDGENRLIAMETSAAAIGVGVAKQKLEFAYDGQSRRFSKKVSDWNGTAYVLSSSILYLYDGWNLLTELNAQSANAVVRSYVWGADLSGSLQGAGGVGGLLLANLGGVTYAPTYDGNGNILGLVSITTGLRSATYEYNAFGETVVADGVIAAANPFRFSTKFTDDESGLLCYGLRYYNPGPGRWLSRDPIGERGGANLYGFVENDGISHFDPLGLLDGGAGNTLKGLQVPYVPGAPSTPENLTHNGYEMGYGGLFGVEPNRSFGPDAWETKQLAQSRVVEIDREKIRRRLKEYCNNKNRQGSVVLRLGDELDDIPWYDYMFHQFPRDMLLNSIAAFTGSASGGTMTASSIDCCKGQAELSVLFFNRSGLQSASRPPPKLFGQYGTISLFGANPFGQYGPMHDFTQTYTWNETLKF